MNYWLGQWVRWVMPLVKEKIEAEWAARSIYARAYRLRREGS